MQEKTKDKNRKYFDIMSTDSKEYMKRMDKKQCQADCNKKRIIGNRLPAKQMTKIAMMIAFISAMSYVRIPSPFSEVAITGQTLALNVIALLLAPGEVFITMLCYWLLGFVGAPVFGGMAGPGKMLGPGGGYFLAFILAGVLIARLRGRKYSLGRYLLITILSGLLVIDGIGFVWLKLVTEMTWETAFIAGVAAFAPLDVIKCVIACVMMKPLKKALQVLDDM